MTTQQVQMSTQDALIVLSNATAALNTTRQQHDLILQALRVLGEHFQADRLDTEPGHTNKKKGVNAHVSQ